MFSPDYTEDDMVSALEWQAERNRLCSGCDQPLDETTAIDAEDLFDAELWRCHACASAASKLEGHRKEGGDLAGMQARIVRRSPVADEDEPLM